MEGRGLCPGFCHPCGQSQASASQPQGTLPWRWSAELAVPCALGVAPALWMPLGKRQQLLWGATAAGSQQAAVPWHQRALELVLCGDRPWGDAQFWLCPTANAQQGLALCSWGGAHSAHGRAHAPVGTSGALTHVPGHPKNVHVGTPVLAGCCCLPQHVAWTESPLLHAGMSCCGCCTQHAALAPS